MLTVLLLLLLLLLLLASSVCSFLAPPPLPRASFCLRTSAVPSPGSSSDEPNDKLDIDKLLDLAADPNGPSTVEDLKASLASKFSEAEYNMARSRTDMKAKIKEERQIAEEVREVREEEYLAAAANVDEKIEGLIYSFVDSKSTGASAMPSGAQVGSAAVFSDPQDASEDGSEVGMISSSYPPPSFSTKYLSLDPNQPPPPIKSLPDPSSAPPTTLVLYVGKISTQLISSFVSSLNVSVLQRLVLLYPDPPKQAFGFLGTPDTSALVMQLKSALEKKTPNDLSTATLRFVSLGNAGADKAALPHVALPSAKPATFANSLAAGVLCPPGALVYDHLSSLMEGLLAMDVVNVTLAVSSVSSAAVGEREVAALLAKAAGPEIARFVLPPACPSPIDFLATLLEPLGEGKKVFSMGLTTGVTVVKEDGEVLLRFRNDGASSGYADKDEKKKDGGGKKGGGGAGRSMSKCGGVRVGCCEADGRSVVVITRANYPGVGERYEMPVKVMSEENIVRMVSKGMQEWVSTNESE